MTALADKIILSIFCAAADCSSDSCRTIYNIFIYRHIGCIERPTNNARDGKLDRQRSAFADILDDDNRFDSDGDGHF